MTRNLFDLNTIAYASRALSPGRNVAAVPIDRLEAYGLGTLTIETIGNDQYFAFTEPDAVRAWVAELGARSVAPDGQRQIARVEW